MNLIFVPLLECCKYYEHCFRRTYITTKMTIVDTQPPPRVFAPTAAMMVLKKLFICIDLIYNLGYCTRWFIVLPPIYDQNKYE